MAYYPPASLRSGCIQLWQQAFVNKIISEKNLMTHSPGGVRSAHQHVTFPTRPAIPARPCSPPSTSYHYVHRLVLVNGFTTILTMCHPRLGWLSTVVTRNHFCSSLSPGSDIYRLDTSPEVYHSFSGLTTLNKNKIRHDDMIQYARHEHPKSTIHTGDIYARAVVKQELALASHSTTSS